MGSGAGMAWGDLGGWDELAGSGQSARGIRAERLTGPPSAAGLGQQPPAMDFGRAATALPKCGTEDKN